MDSVVHVVLCGNRNVLKGIAVTVRSALENSSVPLGVNLLATDWSASDLELLRQSWEHQKLAYVRVIDIQRRDISSFRSTAYLKSKAAYSRYYMGRIPDAERLVYLDTDLLISLDLAEAAAIDMDGCTLAAVRDVCVRVGDKRLDYASKLERRLRISNGGDYFNSGFLIVDVERWRAGQAEDKLVKLSIERFDDLDSQDQDALNVIFERDVKFLSARWNLSQYEFGAENEPEWKQPPGGCIVHLIGTVKPWHNDYNHIFKRQFEELLGRTAYAGEEPDNVALTRKIPTWGMVLGKVRHPREASLSLVDAFIFKFMPSRQPTVDIHAR